MSRTVSSIISHAYRSIGVARIGQDVSGDSAVYGLEVLNEMLDKWTSDGITHGLSDVQMSTVIYNGALTSAVRKNLAVELSIGGGQGGSAPPFLERQAFFEKQNLMAFDGELEYDESISARSNNFTIESGYQ